jgi:type VI protein secretion system component VasK
MSKSGVFRDERKDNTSRFLKSLLKKALARPVGRKGQKRKARRNRAPGRQFFFAKLLLAHVSWSDFEDLERMARPGRGWLYFAPA